MSIINKIGSFIWRSWFVFLAAFATLIIGIFRILPFVFREKDLPIAYSGARIWAKVIFYGSGMRYEKHFTEDISQYAPYIVIANHTSMMDVMLIVILNKKPVVFVGKKELMKMPIFGYIVSKMGILVDRRNLDSRKQVYIDSNKKIKEGKSIGLFAEGGVPAEEIVLDKFKDGAFVLAIRNQVPLITMTFCGLKESLPFAYFRGYPAKVHVYLNSIVSTVDYDKRDVEMLKKKSRDEILETLEMCEKQKISK